MAWKHSVLVGSPDCCPHAPDISLVSYAFLFSNAGSNAAPGSLRYCQLLTGMESIFRKLWNYTDYCLSLAGMVLLCWPRMLVRWWHLTPLPDRSVLALQWLYRCSVHHRQAGFCLDHSVFSFLFNKMFIKRSMCKFHSTLYKISFCLTRISQ